MPYFDPSTGFESQTDLTPDWLKNIPPPAPPAEPKGNWLTAGLGSGFHGLLSDVGGLGEAAGAITGWQGLQDAAHGFAQSQQEEAQKSARPELEFGAGETPWYSPSKLGYNVAKALPGIAGMLGAGALVPEAVVPAWLARAGVAAPKLIGGAAGGGLAEAAGGGLDAATAAVNAARSTGLGFGRGMIGATAAGLPMTVGANVAAEEQAHPDQALTRGQGLAALAVGLPEAALGGLFPATFAHGGGKTLGSKILRGAMAGGGVNALNAGLQTGLTQFLTDDQAPIADRAQAVVQSALEGGVIGSIFGGAFGALHKPPGKVDNQDLKTATDAVTGEVGGLPAVTEQTPPSGPYAGMPSAQIQAMFEPLNAKGATRSHGETLQHVVLGDEIARRTAPGLTPGEGTLFEPQQLAERQPAVAALAEKVIPKGTSPTDPFVKTFNAANEPELVNSLQKRLTDIAAAKGAVPDWLGKLADSYGVARDGKGVPLLDQLTDLTDQYRKSAEARKAAVAAGDSDTVEATAATMEGLRARIAQTSRLIDTHNQAADLLEAARKPPPPAGLLGNSYDAKFTEVPEAAGLPAPGEPAPALSAPPLQIEDQGAVRRKAFQDGLQADLAERFPSHPPGTVEAIGSLNAENPAEAAINLREMLAHAQREGVPAHSVIEQLAIDHGLIDANGAPRDLAAEREAAYADPVKAAVAGEDGSEINKIEKFQDLQHGPVDSVPDNVRPVYGEQWNALDAFKDASAPIREIADKAKGLIESNAQDAGPAADLALSEIERLQKTPTERDFGKLTKQFSVNDVLSGIQERKAAKEAAKQAEIDRQNAEEERLAAEEATPKSTLEERIREAHRSITGGALNARVELGDLRARLPDIERADLDKALTALHLEPNNGIDLSASSWMPDRTPERLAEAVNFKGEQLHQLIANPRTSAPEITKAEAEALAKAEPVKPPKYNTWPVSRMKAELDRISETADEATKAEIGTALGNKTTKPGLLDLLKKFGSSESGSLNIGKIADFFKRDPEQEPTTSPQGADARVKAVKEQADTVRDQVSQTLREAGSSAPVWLQKTGLIMEHLGGIVRLAGKNLRSSEIYRDTRDQIEGIQGVKNKAAILAGQAYHALKPDVRELYDEVLTRLQTGLDFRKPLDPTELLDANGDRLPNAAEMEARHKEGAGLFSRLQQKGGKPALDLGLMRNQADGYQQVGAMLHAFGKVLERQRGTEIEALGKSPGENYQFQRIEDVLGTRNFFTAEAQRLLGVLQTEHDARMAEAVVAPEAERAQMLKTTDNIKSAMALANDRLGQIYKGTYSPLGHGDGEYFVSGKIALGEDKKMVPGAMAAVQKAFQAAGFHDVGFFLDGENNSLMTRLDSMTKMERAANVLRQAEQDGHLIAGETRNGHVNNPASMQKITPKFIQEMIGNISDSIKSADLDEEVGQAISGRMISQLMDMLPDSSIIPNQQARKYVSGLSKNMGEVAIAHSLNSVRSSTVTEMAYKTAAAFKAMKDEVEANQKDQSLSPKDSLIGSNARREIMIREAQAAWRIPHSVFDTIRSITHSVFIGASIPYTILPTSQILTTVHGELAKKTGNVSAMKLIGSSTSEAFRIMAAMARGANGVQLGFRESDLKAAKNISDKSIDTVMRLENGGGLTSFTRMVSDLGEGANSTHARINGYMNALGSYSETFPRVLAAIASGKLYDSKPAGSIKDRYGQPLSRDAYVRSVVDESLQRWGPGEASRLTGGKGPLGSFGKLAFAFTGFRTQMLVKLIGEVHDLISKDSTPELRREAGTFLASHLVATIALAGTVGLPATGLLAGVFDKTYAALTGKDDMDIEGLYRTWLAHATGSKAVGDALAKGLPRLLGVDLSHIGEENIIPFSELVHDKRKFEDAKDDFLNHMAGPAIGEAGNAYLGLRDIVNGDYMLGLQRMLPGNLKDIAEASYISEHGFVNRAGQKEPITPTESRIIMKALGFKSTAEAQYDEASRIAGGLADQRMYRQQNITQHLIRASMLRDPQELHDWLAQAAQFQVDHPGLRGPEQMFNRNLNQKVLQQNYANALGMPLGIGKNDFITRSRLGFMDASQ